MAALHEPGRWRRTGGGSGTPRPSREPEGEGREADTALDRRSRVSRTPVLPLATAFDPGCAAACSWQQPSCSCPSEPQYDRQRPVAAAPRRTRRPSSGPTQRSEARSSTTSRRHSGRSCAPATTVAPPGPATAAATTSAPEESSAAPAAAGAPGEEGGTDWTTALWPVGAALTLVCILGVLARWLRSRQASWVLLDRTSTAASGSRFSKRSASWSAWSRMPWIDRGMGVT